MLEPITLRFLDAHPDDAARVLETLDAAALAQLMGALPDDTAARVLRHMTPDALAGCLRVLGRAAAPIVAHLPVAVSSPALRGLDTAVRRALLQALPKTVSVPLGLALRYPRGTVGTLLDPQAASVQVDMTVGETVQIARRAPELLRRYVYVLDERQQLVGVLDVRECLLAARGTLVRALMRTDPVFLRARASIAEAAAHPGWATVDVLPVVDRPRTFLGVLRRRAVEAALGTEASPGDGEPDVAGAVVDLANLYWQASTAMFLGGPDRGSDDRER